MKITQIKLKETTRDELMTIKYARAYKSIDEVIQSLILESKQKEEKNNEILPYPKG